MNLTLPMKRATSPLRPAQMRQGARARRTITLALVYLVAILGGIVFMTPFVWAVNTGLKSSWEVLAFPPTFFPREPRWVNFVEVFQRVPFATWFANSALVTVLSAVGTVCSATPVAYGFARLRFPGRRLLFLVMLSTMMLPLQVTIIPLFLGYRAVGWLDTHLPLIVPSFFGGGAFYIFLLRQFFLTIPKDLDEAAEIDGANRLYILLHIIVPLSKPVLTTVVIFSFLASWNAFLEPLFFLNTADKFTLPIGLRFFQTLPMQGGEPKWHYLMAASTLMTVPVILVFFLGQRYFIQGVTMTGIKG